MAFYTMERPPFTGLHSFTFFSSQHPSSTPVDPPGSLPAAHASEASCPSFLHISHFHPVPLSPSSTPFIPFIPAQLSSPANPPACVITDWTQITDVALECPNRSIGGVMPVQSAQPGIDRNQARGSLLNRPLGGEHQRCSPRSRPDEFARVPARSTQSPSLDYTGQVPCNITPFIPSHFSSLAAAPLPRQHTLHPLLSFTFFIFIRPPLSRQLTLQSPSSPHILHQLVGWRLQTAASACPRRHPCSALKNNTGAGGWASNCAERHRPARANAPARLIKNFRVRGVNWRLRTATSARRWAARACARARHNKLMQGQGPLGWAGTPGLAGNCAQRHRPALAGTLARLYKYCRSEGSI